MNYLTGDTLVSKRKSSSAFLVGNRWHGMVCCICLLLFSRADKSIYHALGYGVFMYLKAVMTFEQVPKKKIHKYCPFECGKSIHLCGFGPEKYFAVRVSSAFLNIIAESRKKPSCFRRQKSSRVINTTKIGRGRFRFFVSVEITGRESFFFLFLFFQCLPKTNENEGQLCEIEYTATQKNNGEKIGNLHMRSGGPQISLRWFFPAKCDCIRFLLRYVWRWREAIEKK